MTVGEAFKFFGYRVASFLDLSVRKGQSASATYAGEAALRLTYNAQHFHKVLPPRAASISSHVETLTDTKMLALEISHGPENAPAAFWLNIWSQACFEGQVGEALENSVGFEASLEYGLELMNG